MADGLVNYGIIRPEFANAMAMGYNQAEQTRQTQQMNQAKLDQIKQDRETYAQLRAAGTDPAKLFAAMIGSGNPDYISKGFEGQLRLKQLQDFEATGRRLYPELFGPTAETQPAGRPADVMAALAPKNAMVQPTTGAGGTEAVTPTPATASAATNALAPAATNALAPKNALATQLSSTGKTRQQLEGIIFLAEQNPMYKGMAKTAELELQEMMKPPVYHNVPGVGLVNPRDKSIVMPSEIDSLITKINDPNTSATSRKVYQQRLSMLTSHAPGTTVNVSTEKKYGEAFGGNLAKVDIEKMESAQAAPQLAENANRIIDLVKQGNVFTGPAADIKLNMARAMNVAGANNQEKIANTESLIAATGQATLNAIKGAGLGTGQGFTDKDLRFLQGVAGGTVSLTQQTLTDLAMLQHRVATRAAEQWNKRVKEMPQEVVRGTGLSIAPITVPPLSLPVKPNNAVIPTAPAPAGIDENIWRFMTPQEQALWLTPKK